MDAKDAPSLSAALTALESIDRIRVNTLRPVETTLSEDDVRAIRASSELSKTLQHRYGVSKVTIWKIRTGRSWAWVK